MTLRMTLKMTLRMTLRMTLKMTLKTWDFWAGLKEGVSGGLGGELKRTLQVWFVCNHNHSALV